MTLFKSALLAAGFLLVSPLSALAEEACGVWSADMSQEEDGVMMVAQVCARHSDSTGVFTIKCADGERLWITYTSGMVGKIPEHNYESGYRDDFTVTAADRKVVMQMDLYEMYGDIGARFLKNGPMGMLLKSGKEFTISSKDGFYPPETFSLKGSGAAIKKVEKSCN